MPAPELLAWQRDWQHAIVAGDHHASLPIVADAHGDAATRLGVYVDAYALRLHEVLAQDYAALAKAIGHAKFERLARAYIGAQASDTPSVRWFGRHFPAWLKSRRTRPGWLAELAAFEWAQGELFDATDASSIGADQLAKHPAAHWPTLQLRMHPAMRVLRLRWNVPGILQSIAAGEPIQPRCDAARHWLLWRDSQHTHWRELDPTEAAALDKAMSDQSLASIASGLARRNIDPAAVPGRLAALLQTWLGAGLVTGIRAPDPDS